MAIQLLAGLLAILIGAELFTNGVEWLGSRLGLSEGAVGNLLAAVGTALPESIIPLVAFLGGDRAAMHIGIGAISVSYTHLLCLWRLQPFIFR